MFQQIFIALVLLLFVGCGSIQSLDTAGIKPGDTISLIALDGSVPLMLTFESPPVSTQTTTSKTIGVTLTGFMDITQQNSLAAYQAIQGLQDIALGLRFINIKRETKELVIAPIKQGDPLRKPITRETLPFAIEDIAQIAFVIDQKEVAFYPPPPKK